MVEAAVAGAAAREDTGVASQTTPDATSVDGAAPWYGGFDHDTQAYLRNKGWTNDNGPGEVVKAYRHLERLQRSEHVAWP
ncbi:MAG: hypothetical protein ABUL54_11910, partial [Dongia sp.]